MPAAWEAKLIIREEENLSLIANSDKKIPRREPPAGVVF
jgi:hypothetical protein